MKRIQLTFLIISMACLLMYSSCKKDQDGQIPFVQVDVTLLLDQPSNIDLSIVGGWIYITGGSKGILIYRSGPEEFIAMDRHCTHNSEDGDRVYVLDSNIIAADTLSCGSRFVMTDGSVAQGPAEFPLTRYQTAFNGTSNQLRIYN